MRRHMRACRSGCDTPGNLDRRRRNKVPKPTVSCSEQVNRASGLARPTTNGVTMKAIQMSEQGGPEVLQLVELPDPQPGPGEVVIKVDAAAVNFSDLMRRRGDDYPVPTPLPFVPGAEVAGTVAALGEGVDGPAVGTPVFALVGADASGGYAELALAFAPNVIPIPPGLEPDAAAGIVVAG